MRAAARVYRLAGALVAGVGRRRENSQYDSPNSSFDNHLPSLRACEPGNDAHGRMPMALRVPGLQGDVASKGWSLLRVLFVRNREVPSITAGAGRRLLLLGRLLPGRGGAGPGIAPGSSAPRSFDLIYSVVRRLRHEPAGGPVRCRFGHTFAIQASVRGMRPANPH